jgi:hypothetical protein
MGNAEQVMEGKKDKVLLAGPWVGELGWTLFCFQGYIRYLSQFYKETHVISRPNEDILYADFAAGYHEFDPKSWKTSAHMCYDMGASPNELIASIPHDDYFSGNFNIDITYDGRRVLDNRGLFAKQIFHKYQKNGDAEPFDLILHPRNKATDAFRNWGVEKWQQLVNELKGDFTMAVIGNEQAYHLKGTADLRGISLSSVIDHMCSSKMVVGPSSGPMHLASLCGAKHLVWSSEINRMRYETWWNPFKTEVIMVTNGDYDPRSGWNPEVNLIKQKINESIVRSGIQPDIH